MRMLEIIDDKKNGKALSTKQIEFFVREYTAKNIPDYQASALLMAIRLNGMSAEETTAYTLAMAHSGKLMDVSTIDGIKVDKHSTGGVGDKTTLIVAPIVAACGVKVAKMSGRGLGHTGGTLDKLESIPGVRTDLSIQRLIAQVQQIGLCIAAQTDELAPADKLLYALRDVTSTVDSIPLIAASVMSKKLAAGSDCILLDVKVGSGAFIKDVDSAIALAQLMVQIGEKNAKRTVALVTTMDVPLGRAVGNALEVQEVADVLQGKVQGDLLHECCLLAQNMLELAGLEDCENKVHQALAKGSAYEKFTHLVRAQGGHADALENLPAAQYALDVCAPQDGVVSAMHTEKIGVASSLLGAGRFKLEDAIDPAAGLHIFAKTGDAVKKGDVLMRMFANQPTLFQEAAALALESYSFCAQPVERPKLLFAKVTRDGIYVL